MSLEWKCAIPWLFIVLLLGVGIIGAALSGSSGDISGMVMAIAILGAGGALGFTITYAIANRITGEGTMSLEMQCLIPWLGLMGYGVATSIFMALDPWGNAFDFIIGSVISIAIGSLGYYVTHFIASRV